ncbi:hypothetical protein [Pontibacter sp. G13]|uniref:hypothetical protein n=1 Tax=Pontibacter sp. G13 TaxID=3074898 RepID=UPI00288AB5FC|nr:hypothetical protein [Pontibacter sp. G13]WNJ17763.1 hypothetical protein RJD25_23165 [Pontibacter sp. G13]
MVRSACLLILSLLFFGTPVRAERVLEDLDFNSGNWAMIGVPLHNYKLLPIQEELGTFVSRDLSMMKKIQEAWDLDVTYDSKCDYHYALKFYEDGKLIKTLTLNLHCGYLTYQGLSYEFSPNEFELFRNNSTPIAWSRISFKDLGLLKEAVSTLDNRKDIFWYDDVHQYVYPGFFMISVNNIPWNSDLDSLHQVVHDKMIERTASTEFYLQEYFHVIRGDKLFVRYVVNCEEHLAGILEKGVSLPWRPHIQAGDSVSILAIGIDETKYRQLMGQQ